MTDLKLGPLPNQKTARIAIEVSEALKEELDAYAAEHSRLYGAVKTAALIPHMLEAFLRTDRGWRNHRKQVGQGHTGQRRVAQKQASTDPHNTPQVQFAERKD